MTTWWLETLQTSNEALLSSIKSLSNIQIVSADNCEQNVRRGDVCLCTGTDISRSGNIRLVPLSQAGANLVVLPPYEKSEPIVLLPQAIEIQIQSVDFVPAKIVDEELCQAYGLDEIVILYNQVFSTFPGKPAVVSGNGLPVVVNYQHRSTWGSIVLMTLLLGSGSARSKLHHRVAFINCLSKWLSKTTFDNQISKPKKEETGDDIRLSPDYPLLILALSRLPSSQPFRIEELISNYENLRNLLGNHNTEKAWKTGLLEELVVIGLIERIDEQLWLVMNDLLMSEVNRLNLAGYARRLS